MQTSVKAIPAMWKSYYPICYQTLIIFAPACMSFEFLLLRLKFTFWNSLLWVIVLRQILWIKKRVMWGKGKKSSCMCLFEGKVEHCAWLTVRGPGAGANHTASKWREDLWKPEWHLLPRSGMKYGNPRKSGNAWTSKMCELSGRPARWNILYL